MPRNQVQSDKISKPNGHFAQATMVATTAIGGILGLDGASALGFCIYRTECIKEGERTNFCDSLLGFDRSSKASPHTVTRGGAVR